jgi:hypothetical protein
MTQYDYIIIGAGQSDLTPNPSPKGEGNRCSKNKAPVLSTRAGELYLLCSCA